MPPFKDWRPSTAKRRRAALRKTLQNIVKLAGELQVDALTIGGDLYEDLRAKRGCRHNLFGEQLGQLAVFRS